MNTEIITVYAKRKDTGEWIKGGLVKHKERTYIVQIYEYVPDTRDWDMAEYYEKNPVLKPSIVEVDPDTICRNTGLKDKTENDIWEGDTVMIYDRKETICYKEGAFCFENIAGEYYPIINTEYWHINTKVLKHAFDEN